MSYVVTARKWRPQTFAEVIGQEHITHTLENAVKQGRIAHAYLFSGTRGVGKTTTARILAKALNCVHGPTPVPCNRCSLCQEINAGSSVDVMEIDGASNRGIDEIRELRESVRYAPAQGKYRVYIIDEVHMLTKEAFNALLKTLEEPPPHVIFIFATTEPHRIPVTILSRCQHFAFRRLTSNEIVSHLQTIARAEGVRIEEEGLRLIAKSAEGSMRDAQSLFDQLVAFGGGDDAARSTREISAAEILSLLGMVGREHLDRFVDAILDRNPAEILRLIDEFFLYGQDSRELCGNLLEYFRNLLVVKTVADPQGLLELPATAIADLQRRAERVSAEELHTFFQLLSEVEGALRDSAYPRLLLEMTLLKMTTLPRLIPLSHLLDRLEALERSLGNRVAMSPPVKAPPAAERAAGGGSGREERPEDKPLPRPPSDKEELWRQIVHKVRDRKISLGAILEEGQLLRIDDQILELGFQGENPFFRESVLSLENLKLISEVVAEVCGGRKKIKIGELSSSPPEEGTINNQEGRTLESPSPLEQEVLQDALELFGGRIVESRISEDSEEVISGSPFEESDTLDTEERDHG